MSSFRCTSRFTLASVAALGVVLAACDQDPVSAAAARPAPGAPHFLLAPGEFARPLVDSLDAAGNRLTVTEYAAGVYTQSDGTSGSVGSVTIRTFIPASPGGGSGGGSGGACITSTVVGVQTVTGWASSVKKPGGCDKEIGVELTSAATRQKAVFSFLVQFGKTRIDYGAVR